MADVFAWVDSAGYDSANRILTASGDLKTDLSDLESAVNAHTGWVGPEHDLYKDIFTEWTKGREAITKALAGVEQLVHKGTDGIVELKKNVRDALDK